MDGWIRSLQDQTDRVFRSRQRTLKTAISCVGIGVHTGRRVNLTIRPAGADDGIVFRRTDLRRDIAARFDNVVDTRLCTVVADPAMASARVGTIEHLMAAFAALGIENALVELDGPEVPILDGSAAPYLFLLDCAGVVELETPRRVIEILHPIRVARGEAWAELRPLDPGTQHQEPVLEMDLGIEFTAKAIGCQSASLRLAPDSFRRQVASARTFAHAAEVAQLHAAGMARGGSLDNAIVVDNDTILNPGGLRMANEFANHKLVDAVGDLALAGVALHGRYVAHRPGHDLNNRLVRALMIEASSWVTAAAAPELVAAA